MNLTVVNLSYPHQVRLPTRCQRPHARATHAAMCTAEACTTEPCMGEQTLSRTPRHGSCWGKPCVIVHVVTYDCYRYAAGMYCCPAVCFNRPPQQGCTGCSTWLNIQATHSGDLSGSNTGRLPTCDLPLPLPMLRPSRTWCGQGLSVKCSAHRNRTQNGHTRERWTKVPYITL